MNNTEYVEQLLNDLEQETPEMAYQQMADNQWLLAWSDHTIVHIEFDPEESRVTLSTGIGQPDPEQDAAIHKSLLMYNTLWSETGGVTLGLMDDEVVQLYSACTCQLTSNSFGSIVRNFVAKALIWRIWVAVGNVEQLPEDLTNTDPETEADSNALFV